MKILLRYDKVILLIHFHNDVSSMLDLFHNYLMILMFTYISYIPTILMIRFILITISSMFDPTTISWYISTTISSTILMILMILMFLNYLNDSIHSIHLQLICVYLNHSINLRIKMFTRMKHDWFLGFRARITEVHGSAIKWIFQIVSSSTFYYICWNLKTNDEPMICRQ